MVSSDRNLAGTIGKNTIFTAASNAMQIVTRFVVVPVVIYHLGLGGYGIWSIIMVTAGYMRFGRYGLKAAFQKYVAEATANGDYATPSKLLSTGSISMLLLSVAGLIPIAIFSGKLAAMSGIPLEFRPAAAHSITLLAVIFAVSNFGAAYEAIMMGGHRIDLTGKFCLVSMPAEAIAIVVLLHLGYGLFAMAVTMAVSELAYVLFCYLAARRILPEVRVTAAYFTTAVFSELFRFAGSYQLVNMLEVLYSMLVPVTILKYFGAEVAGIYAIVTRLVSAALMAQDASILPILSAGSTIFACGSSERVKLFFRKSFKATAAITVGPLAFLAAFGTPIVLVWTGQSDPRIRIALWLWCLYALFAATSRLQLILYRASGKALHDNIRQAFRLIVLALLACFGRILGLSGFLAGLALAESVGVTYMFFAMTHELRDFTPRMLVPDHLRVTAAAILTIGAGLLASRLPPWGPNQRMIAMVKLVEISLACLMAALPAIALTRSLSARERSAIIDILIPWRNSTPTANV